MADFILNDLRGGMNNTDPDVALPEDQSVLSQNTELIASMLGERRLGTTAISLPAGITARDRVTLLFRHLPTSDETAAELWVLGITGTTTAVLVYKTTSWNTVTISDTPTLTGFNQYRWQAVSIHGKIHFAYKSNQDRLHVWDGTTMRRSGHKAPTAAPTGADFGAGTFATVRYYRVRFTSQVAGATKVRSEPSATLTITPSGTGQGIRITKPATISESETHWELEASTDNTNFYILATTAVGTTTYDDTSASYTSNTLSEDVGDYTLIPSPKYLSHDDDRLLWAGSYEDASIASRVGWTPVFGADGVGNDERFETDTDPYKDLDTYENGEITGLSAPMLGGIWVFKLGAIYKLTRTGLRSNAYDSDKYTDSVGAIHGSVVSGLDETGQPCIYFLDIDAGPCRIGIGGIKRCGEDLRATWSDLNIDATAVVTSSLFFPRKKQIIWCLATGSSNTPDKAIVLHTDRSRTFADGVRKGWVLWTGNRAKALTMCLFADNIDDNVARSLTLVPFIGLEGLSLVHRCDTLNADNTVAYASSVKTRPYWLKSILNRFTAQGAYLVAKAVASSQITVKTYRDFEIETTSTISDTSLAASGTETSVIKYLDQLKGAEMRVVQFEFTDPTTVSARWELNQFCVREDTGQGS